MARMNAAAQAFREPSIITNILDMEDFNDVDARRLRYAMNWASYEGMAYRNIHLWATRMKVEFGLYQYTRDIRSPGGALGNFWGTHLMGGLLDLEAGDGEEKPSALPIILPDDGNETLRPAIAKLWQWSNWQTKKSVYTRNGSVMGDSALRVVDNVDKQKVYLQVIPPTMIRDIVKDDFGFVKAYCLEELRSDPRNPNGSPVTYSETATHVPDSDEILFQTFLNGSPYPWMERDGVKKDNWTEPYGFIPFVHVPNIDIGGLWGLSEGHIGRSKFFEADDIASKFNDQIRKIVAGAWFVAGAKTGSTLTITGQASSRDKPEPGREEIPLLETSNADAKITSMVHDLDFAGTNENLRDLDRTIEKLYPELQLDTAIAGNVSGAALRELRRKATAKVIERRVSYDNPLVQAQMMAIAIGGWRQLLPVSFGGWDTSGANEGAVFASFNLDSFEKGDLQHTVGARPVFALDELDRLEESRLLWETAKLAVKDSDVPIEAFLEWQGFSPEKIAIITRANRRAAGNAAREAARDARDDATETDATGNDTTDETEGENVPDSDMEAL